VSDEDTVDAVARMLYRAHDEAMCLGREPLHDFDSLGHHPVVDGWRAVARAAIELGARSDRLSKRDRLLELLDPGTTNFLGTGLALREFMQLHNAEKLAASWSLQSREEQKRRLSAVIRLSVELERIREKENFATRLAELAIESVIEGDWKMVEEWAEHFAFEDERDEIRSPAGSVYATFRELLLQVLRAGKEAIA
jgi:hypothetical protein